LSGLSIQQGIAVTGSVNQHGEIQAIGGATAKIEGFFDICQAKGLTGNQGVIVPEANTLTLMLREDVVQAVAEGKFHIYPVRTVDEGIAILTGVPAGVRGTDGKFPESTVNRRVDDALRSLALRLKAFGRPSDKKEDQSQAKAEQEEDNGSDNGGEPEPPHEPGLPGDEPAGPGDEPELPTDEPDSIPEPALPTDEPDLPEPEEPEMRDCEIEPVVPQFRIDAFP
jgi:hypothetical protein